MDSAEATLIAVIAALGANPLVSAKLSGRIFSDVPQNQPFPYVEVSIDSDAFAANDFSGQAHTVRIQVFSQQASKKEALQLRKLCLEALDRQEESIHLSEGTLVKCEYSGASTCFQEDDGKTWQAIGELEMIVV